ncbi:MAG: Crp/Fnr family transcriptional regulator [Bacilli bacterium]|nr:Crp/Fnr family transcriptional regulator [Bacilli bacterium]
MKNYLDVIKKSPLFHNIEDFNVIPMLGCIAGYKKSYEKGQIIFSEGDLINEIGIVLKGKVELSKYGYNGNKSIIVTLEAPQMFGESYACSEIKKIPVDIISIEDSEILFVNVERILKTCSNACSFHNKMISNLLTAVANKNIVLNKKIEITSKRTTREKLLTYLFLKAKEEGKKQFTIEYDRQSLADYLEVDRSGLSVEISKLCKEGIIDNQKNHFILKRNIYI